MWSRWFFHKLKSVEKLLYVWGKIDIVLFASFLFLLIIFPSNGYAAISKANPYELGNLSCMLGSGSRTLLRSLFRLLIEISKSQKQA